MYGIVDDNIVCLVDTMNLLSGISTCTSCDGHGKRFPYIDFTIDGTSESLKSLGIINLAAKSEGWIIFVREYGPIEESNFFFSMTPGNALKNENWSIAQISVDDCVDEGVRYKEIQRISENIELFFKTRNAVLLKVAE